jgi:hypothetical protein
MEQKRREEREEQNRQRRRKDERRIACGSFPQVFESFHPSTAFWFFPFVFCSGMSVIVNAKEIFSYIHVHVI